MKAEDVQAVEDAIMHFVRYNSRISYAKKGDLLQRLQKKLSKFGFRCLAISDCFEFNEDFDLIIKDADTEAYATLKVVFKPTYKNDADAQKQLEKANKGQAAKFKKYSDVGSTFVLVYKSNKRADGAWQFFGDFEGERTCVHGTKPTTYSYLVENPKMLSEANDELYNREKIADVWYCNLAEVI